MTNTRSVSSGGRSPRENGPKRTGIPTFYRQVVAELRKVVWPTQQQLMTYFVVILVFVVVIMTIVALLDFGLGKAMFAVFA